VARGECGVLLCGGTHAGKSTLSYACAQRGWNYVSTTLVFLLPAMGCER
jgi:hypothetical protein